jgi:lipopolysaccharide export LptBFGC system permease protein LptF
MKLLTLYALFYALPLGLLISLIVKFFRHWRDREVAKASPKAAGYPRKRVS